ncbi:MAG: hypothetical protein NVS1B11_08940 [Terriglobales bacterium]
MKANRFSLGLEATCEIDLMEELLRAIAAIRSLNEGPVFDETVCGEADWDRTKQQEIIKKVASTIRTLVRCVFATASPYFENRL